MTARPQHRTFGLAAVAVALTLVAAACGSDDTASTTTTTVAPATTEAPTTSAAPATTAPTTTPDTNSLAEGSGCSPGTTDSLPDGEWFGYVSDATRDDLEFDLACWFTGDAAAQAAAEDGEESPPPNDYYVRNVNPALRTLGVEAAAVVSWLPSPGDPSTETTIAFADWVSDRTTRGFQPGVWITIAGGTVTEVREQYVP